MKISKGDWDNPNVGYRTVTKEMPNTTVDKFVATFGDVLVVAFVLIILAWLVLSIMMGEIVVR